MRNLLHFTNRTLEARTDQLAVARLALLALMMNVRDAKNVGHKKTCEAILPVIETTLELLDYVECGFDSDDDPAERLSREVRSEELKPVRLANCWSKM
jgi:hypothetical protein